MPDEPEKTRDIDRWGAATTLALSIIGVMLLAWLLAGALPTPSVSPMARAGSDELRGYLPSTADRLSDRGGYASSSACRACHPAEYASWHDSFHRTMTQQASATARGAQWTEVTLENRGRLYRLFRERGRLFVQISGETDGELTHEIRPIVLTTGSHNMQYYWMAAPWADEEAREAAVAGKRVFDLHCASCHRDRNPVEANGPGSLTESELSEPETQEALEDPAHAALLGSLGSGERPRLMSYIRRIQLPGRLTLVPFVYFVRENRWLLESNTFLHPEPPASELGRDGGYWSRNCDQCHTTAPGYRFDERDLLGTTVLAELGIACEACHGQARGHVARYKNPIARYRRHRAESARLPLDDIVNPSSLDHRAASAVCGQCHSESMVRSSPARQFRPGMRLEDSSHVLQVRTEPFPGWMRAVLADEPELFRNVFWPDGTIRVAGRDYNALVLSRCFTEGEMSCGSCHSMHKSDPVDQLSPSGASDAACIGCHRELGASALQHTHHAEDSPGSRCVNCHMPHTSWGLLKATRAHRVDNPVAEPIVMGSRPNACSLCHLDMTLPEIAETLSRWYDYPAIDAARWDADERDTAAALLWLLRGDAVQRAVVAWHMGWEPALAASGREWQAPFLAELLDDPYAAVRFVSGESLLRLPRMDGLSYDFEGPRHHWTSLSAVAIQRWRSGAGIDRPGLLLTGATLDVDRIRRLLAERDDTEVLVAE